MKPFDSATLDMAAIILDDLEGVRIANANRLRQLTRTEADSDGEERGFGLSPEDPAVQRLRAMVDVLDQLDKDATKNLQKAMQAHPLHPWVKAQKGLGDKQVARLLAAIGDPYWNFLHDRPRTVSELWAYCGYHVIHPGGHAADDPQMRNVAGVAPKRQRGQQANWSEDARKRCYVIVESVIKAGGPYREVYDATKAKYEGATHSVECKRCGPKGKPALVGSALSKGHVHARAIRATAKAILKDLWIESRRLHGVEDEEAA